MMTVKELAKRTGISARTLHYYDEIGLLTPTTKSEAGYRLYDDKALEILQQILFFKEYDLPLKAIKEVLENPALDRNAILQMQRKMLVSKKKRMERLIASIDDILKGENRMDFTIFNEAEIHTIYDMMVENMNDAQKQVFIGQYGSMEAFKSYFLEAAASKEAQENFAQVVKWYGSKEAAIESVKEAKLPVEMTKYQERIGAVQAEFAGKIGTDVNAQEVRALVEEYICLSKKLYQMEDVTALMKDLAKEYTTNAKMQEAIDAAYGAGVAAYMGRAIEVYYEVR